MRADVMLSLSKHYVCANNIFRQAQDDTKRVSPKYFRTLMPILNQKGLTLIETLVTLGIFSTVVVFTMGLFISANKAQVAASEMNLVNSEGSYLLERIGREIRMASKNDVGDIDIPTTGPTPLNDRRRIITFTNNESLATKYCKAIDSSSCNGTGQNIAVSYDNGASYALINSSSVSINNLLFYLNGGGANEQPIVTIYLEVASKKIPSISISLQTSVVPRVY